jgi:hypothetical protein
MLAIRYSRKLVVVTCLRADVRTVTPFADAVLYLDPPYQGTSCGYAMDLPRADVVALARAWPRTIISEAEPLDIPGARHLQLSAPTGGGRTASRQQVEWLTIVER